MQISEFLDLLKQSGVLDLIDDLNEKITKLETMVKENQ